MFITLSNAYHDNKILTFHRDYEDQIARRPIYAKRERRNKNHMPHFTLEKI
jgi:hypothetical protein